MKPVPETPLEKTRQKESFEEKCHKLSTLREARNHVRGTIHALVDHRTGEKIFRKVVVHELALRETIETRIKELCKQYSILIRIWAQPGKGVGPQTVHVERRSFHIENIRKTRSANSLDLIVNRTVSIKTQKGGSPEVERVLQQAEILLLLAEVRKEIVTKSKGEMWQGKNPRIEGLLGNKRLEFPIVFRGGYDYFDQPDLFRIEPDDHEEQEAKEAQLKMR